MWSAQRRGQGRDVPESTLTDLLHLLALVRKWGSEDDGCGRSRSGGERERSEEERPERRL